MLKTCTKCTEDLPLSKFYNRSSGKYGVGAWCKACYTIYRTSLREERGSKDTYAKRGKYYKEYAKKYRQTEKNKEYEVKFRERYRGSLSGTISSLLAGAKERAKSKSITYNLDKEWLCSLLEPMLCSVTGSPLTLEIDKSVQHTPFRPSIDRIDNREGYTKDNCRVTCVIYNKAKSDGTDEDVLLMAKNLMEK